MLETLKTKLTALAANKWFWLALGAGLLVLAGLRYC